MKKYELRLSFSVSTPFEECLRREDERSRPYNKKEFEDEIKQIKNSYIHFNREETTVPENPDISFLRLWTSLKLEA